MLRGTLAALVAAASFFCGTAIAAPTGFLGAVEGDAWRDGHVGYPSVPAGEGGLRATFGAPCSSDANANSYFLVAQDDHTPYRVNFHRKLGGSASSNLDNDVPGHLHKTEMDGRLRSGIWGYACRMKRGSSTQYSVHAWGVAVDINSAYEKPGSDCASVPDALGRIWTNHGWTWGKTWKDCMHFQYATGY